MNVCMPGLTALSAMPLPHDRQRKQVRKKERQIERNDAQQSQQQTTNEQFVEFVPLAYHCHMIRMALSKHMYIDPTMQAMNVL